MRKKITISVQDFELELMDVRALALKLTRSAYIKCLVLREADQEKSHKKRRVSDWEEGKE